MYAFASIVNCTIEAISRQQFRDAESLLDGKAAANLRKLREKATEAQEETGDIFNCAQRGQKLSANSQKRLNIITREMAVSRIEVITGLERMATAEKVSLSRPTNTSTRSPDITLSAKAETH